MALGVIVIFASWRPDGPRRAEMAHRVSACAATRSQSSTRPPLVDALRQCAEQRGVAAFHFPGHGRGASAPPSLANIFESAFKYDLPELPELDNLHAAEGAIARAQEEAASLFGAERTWFLVNGSTCGVQAAVMSTCRPGDYLILPRNCHMSALSAMLISGARPRYVQPVYDARWSIAHGLRPGAIEAEILEAERCKSKVGAVLVVSPTYFGVCSRLEEIARLCHRHGIPLIVDEAHGGHFRFHSRFPRTALEQGADIAVQSTHKVLTSLTQSAMLHAQGRLVNRDKISKSLRCLQSSSPSYLLMASLDAAREQMMSTLSASGNSLLFEEALNLAVYARRELKKIPGLVLLEAAAGTCMDELRLSVGLWELGISGTEADDFLREFYRVVAELPSANSLTFALGTGSSRRDAKRLVQSLQALAARPSPGSASSARLQEVSWQQDYELVMSPRDAFFADVEAVDFKEAAGRISAELLCPYPPGIPLVFPGEVISQASLDCLSLAQELKITVSGASDSSLSTILVCKS